MIVTLDGKQLTEAFPESGTLREVVEQVRQEHLSDRIVVSVVFDGRQLDDEEVGRCLVETLDEVQRVDFCSAEPRRLAADTLREVGRTLGAVGAEQAGVADKLHAGQVSDAVTQFSDFVQNWQICQKAILECSGLLGQDLTAIEFNGRPVGAYLDDLAERLRELRDAFENRDMVLLADMIEFELPETCRTWETILGHLADTIMCGCAVPTP